MQEAAACSWFDKIEFFSPETLTSDFRNSFASILSEVRGAGYWIWKLDVLEQTFLASGEGDIIVYCDAGCHINSSGGKKFQEYVDMLHASDYGLLSFQTLNHEQNYTTKECFDVFQVPSDSDIRTSGQISATVLVAKKCDHSLAILNEFRKAITKDPMIITDAYNNLQGPYFLDHRHDQSLLSILRKQYGSILLADEIWLPEFSHSHPIHFSAWSTRLSRLFRQRRTPAPIPSKKFIKNVTFEKSLNLPFWALRLRS